MVLLVAFMLTNVRADEGMWLPSLIGKGRIKDMQAKGLKLTAADLYDINQASLKDAIVIFGGGCTGELISNKGLLLTNHHCGYGQIQSHSSVEHDYLTHGFAAMDGSKELPNPGLSVSFLREMRDVTDLILVGVTDQMTEKERQAQITKNREALIAAETKDQHAMRARVEAMYYGNQYFLFLYDVYEDVRLVFAPPSSVGKFGGDTDNWMWPRHTGDFSIFRVYADKDNKSAKYSESNVPYQPKKSFAISTKGIKEGDFTFVYGFPGRTSEYLHSEAVRYILERGNPIKVNLRTIRLDIMNEHQAADAAVRIKYASKNAGVSNAWKKMQGESKGIKRLGTIAKKQEQEKRFIAWAADKPKYKGVVEKFNQLYDSLSDYAFARDVYSESANSIEILRQASQFADLKADLSNLDAKRGRAMSFYKDYETAIDSRIALALLTELAANVPTKFLPVEFTSSTPTRLVDNIFKKSVFVSKQTLEAALNDPKAYQIITNDPAFVLAKAFNDKQNTAILPKNRELNAEIELLYRTYMQGLMDMNPKKEFYPDANSTLRIAYGKVDGYVPRDGVYYTPVATLDGVMAKDNPEIYDYDVPEKLRKIYREKDYGRWAVNGSVPVTFIASNHTTGGNSGSPVLNAKGELIGVNFDRCWEGTMSDIEYDPTVCRNIAIDIRYVLFTVDKLGGAGYLIDEMNIVQ